MTGSSPHLKHARGEKWLSLWVVSSLVLATLAVFAQSARAQDSLSSQISSARYIVIDADTGEVFAQKGANDEVAIASLTKIFTTVEALERAPLDMEITTNSSDLFDSNSTTMGFGPGETFTLKDLIYGMLLPSGNDAAHAIARAIGTEPGDTSSQESVDRFVGWMNERIQAMGLKETHLVNPHGLGVKGHYSSAHDLAAFMRYALEYPTFVDAIGTSEYTTSDGSYTVTNTNKLLSGNPEVVPGLIGGKTGYDDDAGYCLIEVAKRDGSTMIAVTLDGAAPDIWYEDNALLLDYGFQQKAARVAAGKPITGEVDAFRDPDAAVIQAIATPGGSIGVAPTDTPTPAPTTPPNLTPFPTPPPQATPAPKDKGGGTGFRIVGALVVVVLIVGVSALGGGWRPKIGGLGGGGSPPDG